MSADLTSSHPMSADLTSSDLMSADLTLSDHASADLTSSVLTSLDLTPLLPLFSCIFYSLLRRGGGHEQSPKCDSDARNAVRSSKAEEKLRLRGRRNTAFAWCKMEFMSWPVLRGAAGVQTPHCGPPPTPYARARTRISTRGFLSALWQREFGCVVSRFGSHARNCVCVRVSHLNRCKTSLGRLFGFHYNMQGACGHHANACQRSHA